MAAALRATATEPGLHRGADELSSARAETEEVWGVLMGCPGPVGSAEPSGAPGDGKDVEHSGGQFSLSSPYRAMVGPPSPESLHDLWLQPTALFD